MPTKVCKKEIVPLCTKQEVKVPKEVGIIIIIIIIFINVIIVIIIALIIIIIVIRFARGCQRIFARTRLRNDALQRAVIIT